MRLLNTNTLQLAEFFEADVPPYAILSHRWGKDEVSFKDFRKGLLKEGKGYEKIVKCCEIAAAEGLEWAWVDTCCIDKPSSAELSEAINSMFQWYAKSKVCYAFLADVHPVEPSGTTILATAAVFDKDEFCASSWFTRGWTLQELLAPRTVFFFNSAYEPIGVKARKYRDLGNTIFHWGVHYPVLNALICDATGIPEQYIGCEAAQIHVASVGERMRWVTQRNATRVEDIAYCLLGIFDVNMPLLYGEGEKAFTRLQVEILRRNADESLLAWSSSSSSPQAGDLLAPAPRGYCFLDSTRPTDFIEPSRQALAVTSRGVSIETAVLEGVPVLYVLDIHCDDWVPPVAVLLHKHRHFWAKADTRLFHGRHLIMKTAKTSDKARTAKHADSDFGKSSEVECLMCKPEPTPQPRDPNFDKFVWFDSTSLRGPTHFVDFSDEDLERTGSNQVIVCQPNDVCTYIKRSSQLEWHPGAVGRKITDRWMILDRTLHKRIYIRQYQGW